jgi:hypothetical protein
LAISLSLCGARGGRNLQNKSSGDLNVPALSSQVRDKVRSTPTAAVNVQSCRRAVLTLQHLQSLVRVVDMRTIALVQTHVQRYVTVNLAKADFVAAHLAACAAAAQAARLGSAAERARGEAAALASLAMSAAAEEAAGKKAAAAHTELQAVCEAAFFEAKAVAVQLADAANGAAMAAVAAEVTDTSGIRKPDLTMARLTMKTHTEALTAAAMCSAALTKREAAASAEANAKLEESVRGVTAQILAQASGDAEVAARVAMVTASTSKAAAQVRMQ